MGMNYLGDYVADETVYVYFNTFDSNDPSASVTTTGLAVTDIEIYKDGSTTQRSSDAGYTLLDTDGIDFDGITGIHGFSIDTSNNTDAGFFATGSDYTVVVSSITVDGATINFIAATFSIQNRSNTLLATEAKQDIIDSVADAIKVVTDKFVFTVANQVNSNAISVGGTTQTAGDIPALVTTVDTVVDGIQTDLSNGTDGLGAIKTDTAAILVDTAQIGVAGAGLTDLGGMSTTMKAEVNAEADTAITDAALATAANLATVDSNVDAILVDTGTTLPATLGTPAGADMAADIAAVKADTAAILIDTASIGITKNATFSNFEFPMVLTSDHYTAATSKTVTGERSIDGGAFASVSGTIAEVGSGVYQIDLLAADTNGDVITYKFSATACDDTVITVQTRA